MIRVPDITQVMTAIFSFYICNLHIFISSIFNQFVCSFFFAFRSFTPVLCFIFLGMFFNDRRNLRKCLHVVVSEDCLQYTVALDPCIIVLSIGELFVVIRVVDLSVEVV